LSVSDCDIQALINVSGLDHILIMHRPFPDQELINTTGFVKVAFHGFVLGLAVTVILMDDKVGAPIKKKKERKNERERGITGDDKELQEIPRITLRLGV